MLGRERAATVVTVADRPVGVATPDDEDVAALWRSFKQDGSTSARSRLVHLYYPLVKHVARNVAVRRSPARPSSTISRAMAQRD